MFPARAQRTEAQLKARLKFDYEHPGKGFDAEKVRGVLASLVTPCDGKYAAALEVVAGGRLYQVVVDDEKTGKALLERGQLRRRVTLIPSEQSASWPDWTTSGALELLRSRRRPAGVLASLWSSSATKNT